MKVSLDGGVTFHDAKDVRVIYEGVEIPGEDENGDLHITMTPEGIVTDVWGTDENGDNENPGTDSVTVSELVCRLCRANA